MTLRLVGKPIVGSAANEPYDAPKLAVTCESGSRVPIVCGTIAMAVVPGRVGVFGSWKFWTLGSRARKNTVAGLVAGP
jgi:hypothetical protein